MIGQFNYIEYWENRYTSGLDSGAGSKGLLAEFKIKTINEYIKKDSINSVIEFGCGDGLLLEKMNLKKYLGFDVSKKAIEICQNKFKNNKAKEFLIYHPNTDYRPIFKAELVICLDTLYHIIPEKDFVNTLIDIFESSSKLIILYTNIKSSNYDTKNFTIIRRNTLAYLSKFKEFKLEKIIEQKYPTLSWAKFLILRRI